MTTHFAFVDESGVLDVPSKDQPFFAVGLLKIADTSIIGEKLTQKHYDYFSSQRERRGKLQQELVSKPRILTVEEINVLLSSTRHREYKFTSITPTTIERYKSFLDTAMESHLHFCALVIDKTDPLFDSRIYKNYWSAYIKYAKLLCEKNCGSRDNLCVVADYMSKPTESDAYFERELNTVPVVLNTLRAHSETFMLLQLCDLLLGSVLFQWRQRKGCITNSNRAKAKAEFVKHLLGKLVIPTSKRSDFPLAQAITCNQPSYFSVWPLKLSNTKSGGV